MSYNIENLSFTIFGNGHDYTLLDSGDGDTQVFSHPFVPLNSTHYAGQWYFVVLDENGDPIDAVKDDIAHCTFTPAIGSTFDTEGEIEVKCHYHREYVYPEETIVVDKEVKQTIEVVDHGTVYRTYSQNDIYTDGYVFIRPVDQSVYPSVSYRAYGDGTKVSSIPWRCSSLTNFLKDFSSLTDISELQYADVSNVYTLVGAFQNCVALEDLTGLESWDTSSVEDISDTFNTIACEDYEPIKGWNVSSVLRAVRTFYNGQMTDLKFMSGWNTTSIITIQEMFAFSKLTSLDGLQNFRTSSIGSMRGAFSYCEFLTDISALADWDTSYVVYMNYIFADAIKLSNIDALADWDVSNVTDFSYAFYQARSLTSLSALADWNVSRALNMSNMFADAVDATGVPKISMLHSLDGLDNWNVSRVNNFSLMFANLYFLSDISALANWNVSSGTTFMAMFASCDGLRDIDDLSAWDVSNSTYFAHMFKDIIMCWSPDKNVVFITNNANHRYYDENGDEVNLTPMEYSNRTIYTFDCSGAENWTVNVASPTNCFSSSDGNYINVPAWN